MVNTEAQFWATAEKYFWNGWEEEFESKQDFIDWIEDHRLEIETAIEDAEREYDEVLRRRLENVSA